MSESHEGLSAGNRSAAAPSVERLLLIDALKGIAAQLILLHHLVSYGPLAAAANRLLPGLSSWLYDYGRMAVQVFLVVAGFLAARTLFAEGRPWVAQPLSLIWRRYARLAPPFFLSVLFAVAAAALARLGFEDDMMSALPTLSQLLSYVFFLHALLGVPSLSTGVWYVPIDLQIYALFVVLLWLAGRAGMKWQLLLAAMLVTLLALASLFVFNRNTALDNWGIYFFYAYALGIFAWWLSRPQRSGWWVLLLLAVVALALLQGFRPRVLIAVSIALLLLVSQRQGWLQRWPDSRLLGWLGRISFSVFLVHFPVFMLTSAVYVRVAGEGDGVATLALLLSWGIAVAVGDVFHRHVECRKRWLPPALVARFSLRR